MNHIKAVYPLTQATRLEIVQGNLTHEQVDAIVNAANEVLAHHGGVARAISDAGGPTIQQESTAYIRAHGHAAHDRPAFTSGGRLPAKWVLHAVGPVWGSGNEDQKLATALYSTLELAERMELKSIAFPAISTGIFGFPVARAARIFFETFQRYFAAQVSGLELVRMVLWSNHDLEIFLAVAKSQLGENPA